MRRATIRPRNIEAALDDLGIDYTVRDNEASARCPSPDHHDRSPSWSCNLDTGMHNCFACGFGGSFIRLVMTLRGMPWADAEEWSSGFLRSAEDITARLYAPEERHRAPEIREPDLALFVTPPEDMLRDRMLTTEAAEAYGVLWDTDRASGYFQSATRTPASCAAGSASRKA